MGQVSRRVFLASSVGAAGAFAQQAYGAETPETSERQSMEHSPVSRPNILVIHVDQHRWDCLGCMGNPDLRTPNIDALAADGVRYDNSFCPYPVCTPSRYSLLSGFYVHEHRGSSNHCTLAPDIATFPKRLREAGYKTAAVGKMHFTPTYLDVGFDRMFLCEQDGPGRWDDDYHRDLRREGLVDLNDLEDQRSEYRQKARKEYWETFGALPSNLPRAWHTTEWITARALPLLEEWTPEGNLLMTGFVKPHHPFDPPQELADLYDPDAIAIPPGWTPECFAHDLALHKGYFPHADLTEAAIRRVTAYYYATIEHIDMQVGKMIDMLKRKGLYDVTCIVFTSDHGEYLGFHHLLLKGGYMYDPLARVPLIVKYPGNRAAGTVSEALVNNVDLAPALLGLAGLAKTEGMSGLDISGQIPADRVIFAESGRGGQLMARTARYKLIRCAERNPSFLYDLEADPMETVNRIDDPACADVVAGLDQALQAWRGGVVRTELYLDEEAPVIRQPNALRHGSGHREDIIAYYAEKMAGQGS